MARVMLGRSRGPVWMMRMARIARAIRVQMRGARRVTGRVEGGSEVVAEDFEAVAVAEG